MKGRKGALTSRHGHPGQDRQRGSRSVSEGLIETLGFLERETKARLKVCTWRVACIVASVNSAGRVIMDWSVCQDWFWVVPWEPLLPEGAVQSRFCHDVTASCFGGSLHSHHEVIAPILGVTSSRGGL